MSEFELEYRHNSNISIYQQQNIYPLIPQQLGVWLDLNKNPGTVDWELGAFLTITGSIDPARFEQALIAVAAENDALRLALIEAGDEPLQCILDVVSADLLQVDLSAETDPRMAAMAWMRADLGRPLDLSAGPGWRCALLRCAPDQSMIYLHCHHLWLDSGAVETVFERLKAHYEDPAQAAAGASTSGWRGVLEGRAAYAGSDAEVRDQAFWAGRLAGHPGSVPNLPNIMERPSLTGKEEKLEGVEIPSSSSETLEPLLIASIALLTHKLTSESDVVVSLQAQDHGDESRRAAVGMAPRALPIRLKIAPRDTLNTVLTQARQAVAAAQPHQAYAIDQIQADQGGVGVSRWLTALQLIIERRRPIASFDATPAAYEPLSAGRSIGIEFEARAQAGISGFRLTAKRGDEYLGGLLQRLDLVIKALRTTPNILVKSLNILPPGERRTLIETFNSAPTSALEETVMASIESQVAARPEAVALICGDDRLAYAEMDSAAARLARLILEQGVGPEDVVGVSLRPSLDQIVAILAVMKSGAAYLPLDPGYPADRLAYMVDQAKSRFIITSPHEAGAAWRGHAPEVLFDLTETRLQPGLSPKSIGDAQSSAPLTRAACVLFTSGSTGRPKGVVISHRALTNAARALIEVNQLDAGARYLQAASTSFVIGSTRMLSLLMAGASVVIAEQHERTPEGFSESIAAQGVSHAEFPPSVAKMIAAPALERLRVLNTGGEAMSPDAFDHLRGLHRHVHNYGATETTGPVLRSVVQDSDEKARAGTPYENCKAYVLDASLQPCPIGVVGELYIAGESLARGYLNQPGLTAARFVANPFAQKPGERMCRTGDLAAWRADGNLMLHGRNDGQIKIRGFRIEPGEVEALLVAQPGVSQAAVAPKDFAGETRLVAYLTPEAGSAPEDLDLTTLRTAVSAALPDYMTPAAFMPLAALPLTPNGKLDRRALPDPARPNQSEAAWRYEILTNALESEMLVLWRRILWVDSLSINDDFFAVGGDSIRAMRLIAAIQEEMSIAVPIAALFQHRTVRDLSAHIRANSGERHNWVAFQTGGDGAPLWLTPPLNGFAASVQPLAEALGPDQPVYAFQFPGFNDGEESCDTVFSLAALALQEMRRRRPHGPYRLIGYSFGARVAFEIATQLEAQGLGVDFLGIIDTPAPDKGPIQESALVKTEAHYLAERANLMLWNARLRGREDIPEDFSVEYLENFKNIEKSYEYVLNLFKKRDIFFSESTPISTMKSLVRNYEATFSANMTYRTSAKLSIPIHLFQCAKRAETELVYFDVSKMPGAFGWEAHTTATVVQIEAPGDHDTVVLKPNNHILADRIQQAIRWASSRDETKFGETSSAGKPT